MITSSKTLGLVLLAAASLTVAADLKPPPDRRNFVACPILQDTDTVPCWMADYQGERYFLGIQTDSGGWSPPYLGHKVLVEGKLAGGPRICGGIPLTSEIRLSPMSSGSVDGKPLPNPPVATPMRELDPSCSTLLPADLNYHITPRRGPGPSAAASGPPPRPAPAAAPPTPYTSKTYTLAYEFDSEIASRSINEALNAVQYARAVHAAEIQIVAYRAAALLSDGTIVQELPNIATLRAAELTAAIRKLGIPAATKLSASEVNQPQTPDGVNDTVQRRVEITVVP